MSGLFHMACSRCSENTCNKNTRGCERVGGGLEYTVGTGEPCGLCWLKLLILAPGATLPRHSLDGGGVGRQSLGHFGALAWPASPFRVGLLTQLPVLGTPGRQQFQESCCLREKCVPGPQPDQPSCSRGQRKLQAGLQIVESQGSVAPQGAHHNPCCVAGFLSTCLLSWD